MEHLAESTRKIYQRELSRIADYGIQLKPTIKVLKKVVEMYQQNGVPFSNLRLALFAMKNQFKSGKIPAAVEAFFTKKAIDKMKTGYGTQTAAAAAAATTEEPAQDDSHVTRVSWEDIVTAVRPFIEDESKPAADRLLMALYTLIPPRRTDYYLLSWDPEAANHLTSEGQLSLTEYKTKRTYGEFTMDLFTPSIFHGEEEVALFRNIIGAMSPHEGKVFTTRGGSSYSMLSFATKIKRLFSRLMGQSVSLIDARRAFDQHIREDVLNNPRIPLQARQQLRDMVERATSHSKEMTEYYADKVDMS